MTTAHEQALHTLKLLAKAWKAQTIPWVLIGRYGPDHQFDNDIDLVIHPDHFETAIRTLEHVCDSQGWSIVQIFRHEHRSFAAIIAQEHFGQWSFVAVDISPEFRYDGKIIQSGEELVENRVLQSNDWLYTPNDQAAFVYYLIKCIAKNRFSNEAVEYFNSLQIDHYQVTKKLLGEKAAQHVQQWIKQPTSIDSKPINKAYHQKFPKTLSSRLVELRRFWLRVRKPTGLFIAITGPDGVGKSTVSQKVFQDIEPCFRSVETSHLSVRTTAMTKAPPIVAPYAHRPRGFFGSLAKTLVLITRFHRLYWRWTWLHLRKHGLFWSDRHFADFVADPKRFRVKLPLWIRKLSWKFTPNPDLNFVLLASPQTIQKRCDEVDLGQTTQQLKQYEDLLDHSKQLVRIDANPDADVVAQSLVKIIVAHLTKRQRKRGWMIP